MEYESLAELAIVFQRDIECVRGHSAEFVMLPEAVWRYNKKFGVKLRTLDEVKEGLYGKVVEEEHLKGEEKVELLARVNPDKLWSEAEMGELDIYLGKQRLIELISQADPRFFIEEEYWGDLNSNERATVLEVFTKKYPYDFLKLSERYVHEVGFEQLVKQAVSSFDDQEAVYYYARDPKALEPILDYPVSGLTEKILGDFDSEMERSRGGGWGVNPYLYIGEMTERGDTKIGLMVRDKILERCCIEVEKDVDRLFQEARSKASDDEEFSDDLWGVVKNYLDEKYKIFDKDSELAGVDKRLLSAYIYSCMEDRLSFGELMIGHFTEPVVVPSKFVDRLMAKKASIAQLSVLVRAVDLSEAQKAEAAKKVPEYIRLYGTSSWAVAGDSVADWDIVALTMKFGNADEIGELLKERVDPKIYLDILDSFLDGTFKETALLVKNTVSDEQKLEMYHRLKEEDKPHFFVLEKFKDPKLYKQIYDSWMAEKDGWKLDFDDFLYLKKDIWYGANVEMLVDFYLEMGRPIYGRVRERFGKPMLLFNKSKEEVEALVERLARLAKPVAQMLGEINQTWITDNLTDNDVEVLNSIWQELRRGPEVLLRGLKKLDYLKNLMSMGVWKASYKKCALDVLNAGNSVGFSELLDQVKKADVKELGVWEMRTRGIGMALRGFLTGEPAGFGWSELEEYKKRAIITGRLETLADVAGEYIIYRFMQMKFGMTSAEVNDLVRELTGNVRGSGGVYLRDNKTTTLVKLLSAGLMGRNVRFVVKHIGEIREILEQGVTYSGDLLDYFDVSHPEESLSMLRKTGGKYVSDAPESERLVGILMGRVLSDEKELYVEGRFQPKALVGDVYREKQRQGLKKAFEYSAADVERASKRNIDLVRHQEWVVAEGDLLHTVGKLEKCLPVIKTKINFPKEFLGQAVNEKDSYPGYVDLQEIDPLLLSEITDRPPINSHIYMSGVGIVYLSEGLVVDRVDDSGNYNHRLVPGAISFLQMKAVIIPSDLVSDAEALKKLKQIIAMTGMYVPVYDFGRNLLFGPDEFEALFEDQAAFASLDDLVSDHAMFADLALVKNTGEEISVLEHCYNVRQLAEKIGFRMGINGKYMDILTAAAKLHDVGKGQEGAQEITNVREAERYLDMVIGLDYETKKKILLLIRNDELLGEVLKNMEKEGLTGYGRKKWQQFNDIFARDEMLRKAMTALYFADVLSYGDRIMNEHNRISEKLVQLELLRPDEV